MAYIGNTNTTQAFTPAIDYFSGDGSTVAFTLSRPVASAAQVQVVIENVPQNPGSAFTVSGSTVTFTSAPPSGTNNIYVYYTSPITQVIAPGQGTVTTSSLASGLAFSQWTTAGSDIYYNAGNVGIGTSSPARNLSVSGGASTGYLQVTNSTTGVASTDGFQIIHYTNGGTQLWNYENNYLAFGTNNTEAARIDSSGNLLVGKTSVGSFTTQGIEMNPARSDANFAVTSTVASNYDMCRLTRTAATGIMIGFFNGGSRVGDVSIGASSTSYSTSSDYRLKNSIAPMTGALEKVALLKPCTYKWNADNSESQGFIAHELQEVVPDCVTGEKDAVDADGNPKYQGIDTSFLVATLTAAIQEQQALITTLTERIAALEAK